MKRLLILLSIVVPLLVGSFTANKFEQASEHAVVTYNHSLVFLVLGVDEQKDDAGRSDAIFLATVNPYEKSVMITNIPRDTYVQIPGKYRDKINHSYMFGGEKLVKQTVEKFLKMPIDGYVRMNMQSLKLVVDRIGGIEVTVPFDFSYNGSHFRKGRMNLNGKQALAFSRMRKKDPKGDRGRNERQQEVMRAIIQRATHPYVMLHIVPIVQELKKSIVTDISTLTILQLIYTYHDVEMSRVVTNRLEGNGVLMNGIYYYIVEQDEVNRLRRIINNQRNRGRSL